jgi:hypothetical protein
MRVIHYAELDGRLHAEPLCGSWGSMDTDWTNDAGGVTCEPCRTALRGERSGRSAGLATRSPAATTPG